MFFYKLNGKILISDTEYINFNSVSEDAASKVTGRVYVLTESHPSKSRRSFSISDPSLLFLRHEDLGLLRKPSGKLPPIPEWLEAKIKCSEVTSINASYPGWECMLEYTIPKMWKINVVGLGDVGGILSAGLRLLGAGCISKIGLYDLDQNKIKRWVNEIGQIYPAFCTVPPPDVSGLTDDSLFECDMFVFCVSSGVPPVGAESKDVRLSQFEGNSSIIKSYAKKAREAGFKGIFAVVSDPVDLLCRVVFDKSNTDEYGVMDFKGLAPEQIRGYGLGVMNARACYYASLNNETSHYLSEGRVFGPHGQGLVVADSIDNYNEGLSKYLTEKTANANLEVRAAGFKPYIAPALSSGSLSLIATIKREWHYSATFIGGVFMGSKNRLSDAGIELERLDIPDPLWERLQNTYERLGKLI